MLTVSSLVKRYGPQTAVDGVSFAVEPGQIVGLLGPNGAGKTTTLSMVSGLLEPDAGEVRVDGRHLADDPYGVKRRIGLVPQELALYEELSADANMQLFAGLFGLQGQAFRNAAQEALALVGLLDRRSERVAGFSGGMKRRLNIACSLLHDPDLILCDEPTTGVDPQSRNAIFENLEVLKRRGKALVYTTHYMEEAERLCDRIVIVDHGKVVADDTLHGLYRRLPVAGAATLDLEGQPADAQLRAALAAIAGVAGVALEGSRIALELSEFERPLAAVLELLASRGRRVRSLHTGNASLEDVFMLLTGRALRDDKN
jgi:ABC-2 type transport system ATP-binding protein